MVDKLKLDMKRFLYKHDKPLPVPFIEDLPSKHQDLLNFDNKTIKSVGGKKVHLVGPNYDHKA